MNEKAIPSKWPKPSLRSGPNRTKPWEAKGIDPRTGQRKSYYGSSAYEAAEAAARSKGLLNQEDQTTLYGYYAEVYLPTVAHRSGNWQAQIGWAMDKHHLPALGSMKLQDLTRPMLQAHFNKLATKLGSSSVRRAKIVLSGVLNLAESDGLGTNHCTKIRLESEPVREVEAYSANDLCRMLDASSGAVRAHIILQGFLGLRLGEAAGLAMSEIDWEKGIVRIRRQVVQDGGTPLRDRLKTPNSYRDLPLPPGLLETLKGCCGQIWAIEATRAKKISYRLPNNIDRDFKALCQELGLELTKTHSLRKAFRSILAVELEAPDAITDALMGHASKGMAGTYTATQMESRRKWIGKLWAHVTAQASTAVTTPIVVNGEQKTGSK